MDSGNSGSIQSSSGGDEEFDSRTSDSLSAFLNSSNSSSTHVGVMSSTQQLPPPLLHPTSLHQSHHSSTLFDPLSSYLDAFSHSSTPNSMLNLDMVWPRSGGGGGGGGGLRSEPNCTQPGGLMGGLQSSSSSTQPITTTQQQLGRTPFPGPSSKPLSENSSRPSASTTDPNNAVRNPKKRSRASRRAPTTVLTTDTSNFRAMVQEFTGIPAPPFSASPFPRTRLDLFNNASTMRSSFDHSPPPPYLLRPFAHKVQPPSFVSSSTIASTTNIAINHSTNPTPPPPPTNTNVSSNASNSNSTTNYQLQSELGLSRQSQTLLNMQNPMPTFQSLLQSAPPPKYPLPNVPIFGTKPQSLETIPSTDSSSHLKVGVLEELGMNHGHLGTLSNLVTTGGLSLRSNDSWGEGMGSNDANQTHLRSINVNNFATPQRVTSCKMNFTSSSSDFHTDKTPPENVSTRGEGMVDSWICSSD